MALSNVVRTMLNAFDCNELWAGGAAEERRSCLGASKSDGDVERDVEAVHEEAVEEIELCLSRRQRANSLVWPSNQYEI